MLNANVFPLRRIGRAGVRAESNGDVLTLRSERRRAWHTLSFDHGKRELRVQPRRGAESRIAWTEIAALDVAVRQGWFSSTPVATFHIVFRSGERIQASRGLESDVEEVRELVIQLMGLDRNAEEQVEPGWQPPSPPDVSKLVEEDARSRALLQGVQPASPADDPSWANLYRSARLILAGFVCFIAAPFLAALLRFEPLFYVAPVFMLQIVAGWIAHLNFTCPRCKRSFASNFWNRSLLPRRCVHCGLPRDTKV